MSEKIFFGKQKNDGRDCCVYIDRPRFECGHYYHVPRPTGVCYSSSWGEDGEYDYDYLDTVLTKKEYNKFRQLIDELDKISNGLDKDEEKKKLADAKAEELNKFIDEYLLSAKAIKFAEKIKQGEIEFMKEEYDFDDEDIEDIYDYYGGEYFDRAIIDRVFDSYYDVAEEAIDNNYNIDDWIKSYIDYDKMGEDLVSDGDYVELSDGRIVELCY
jgi:hypothetical protein